MHLSYFDTTTVNKKNLTERAAALAPYLETIEAVVAKDRPNLPEAALTLTFDEAMLQEVYEVVGSFKQPKHVVLIGIGGSSLGVEAVHSVLAHQVPTTLHILDTVAAHELDAVLEAVRSVKKVSDIAVCVISKSGTTTETLVNAEVLLGSLKERFGKAIYAQTVFIGNDTSPLKKVAKKLEAKYVAMPEAVGGRYSIFSPVGLVPLLLLGHDVEAFLSGAIDVLGEEQQQLAVEGAARLALYAKAGYHDYNFFAFDTRLVRLGKWYRQLLAESIGKEKTANGKKNTLTWLPTVSTPVELHSVGQLYFSGVVPVYTDFVSFDDELTDYEVPKAAKIATAHKGKSMQEVATAIYGGVIAAYQERKLPYRTTVFADESLAYSLGLFMSLRLLETMCVAQLLSLNAFDQPNVELYKEKTKKILHG